MRALEIRSVTGSALEPFVDDLARLRIAIFRAYPYLYDGDRAYEMTYLRAFAAAGDAIAVLALAGDRVVGMSTGLPLGAEVAAFREPFERAGRTPETVFYCAESLLEPDFRGGGTYRAFFARREAHARALGCFTTVAFCAVDRPVGHALRPLEYAPLDPVWRRFGYSPQRELVAHLAWKDVDRATESDHALTFWTKSLA